MPVPGAAIRGPALARLRPAPLLFQPFFVGAPGLVEHALRRLKRKHVDGQALLDLVREQRVEYGLQDFIHVLEIDSRS